MSVYTLKEGVKKGIIPFSEAMCTSLWSMKALKDVIKWSPEEESLVWDHSAWLRKCDKEAMDHLNKHWPPKKPCSTLCRCEGGI